VSAIPPGFARSGRRARSTSLGPFYVKRDGDVCDRHGGRAKHQNSRGIVHGGMICTLIDFALG
jgi:acyl-coenzyme A thioesterase PaaI-like protein